jgi:hypothetical protein
MAKGKERSGAKRRSSPDLKPAARTPRAMPAWVPWAMFVLVVALSGFVVMRAHNPSPHSGGDNAGYLTLAYSLLDRGAYLDLYEPGEPIHTKYPPGYPGVLALLMLAGARTWGVFKATSAVFVVGAVGVSYLWAWRRRNWVFAVGLAALLALTDSFIYSSQWVLSDPLFLILTLFALLAFDRAYALDLFASLSAEEGTGEDGGSAAAETPAGADVGGSEAASGATRASRSWLIAGCAAAILAYFTRSAGLPLVLAVLAWLALRRRLRTAAMFAIAFAVPAVLWWLRGTRGAQVGYVSEFWMVNPYDPSLGTVGVFGLLLRVWGNAALYFGSAIPAGITGLRTPLTGLLGLLIVAFSLGGWVRRMRRPGVAELFVPLYFGLILLWPEVWSGDRFALPLFPLVLFYAGESLVEMARAADRRAPVIAGAVALALLIFPAAIAWRANVAQASHCQERVQTNGAFGCYTPRMREYVSAAKWSGANLPDTAVVLTRKPRIFYLMGGVKARTFPLHPEADSLVAAAEGAGAAYALIDYIDNIASLYLVPAVHERPGGFCALAGFGGDERGIQTQLLGILPPAEWDADLEVGSDEGVASVTMKPCDLRYSPETTVDVEDQPSTDVPLLKGLDS